MLTVGSRLVSLDAFSALVAILAQAATVHLFAIIGVPVSVSQAIVGAVLGIGLAKGVKTINRGLLLRVVFGWVGTPTIAGLVCFAAAKMFL
jgi:PiT family inorganic phosphate transporter